MKLRAGRTVYGLLAGDIDEVVYEEHFFVLNRNHQLLVERTEEIKSYDDLFGASWTWTRPCLPSGPRCT